MSYNGSYYAFGKSFEEQVKDYEKGQFPKEDTLVVGKTPEIFRKIGLNALPMTFTQKHLNELLNPTDDDHTFTRHQIYNLPKYLENPIAIIESRSPNAKENSIVAILDTSHNADAVKSEMNGNGGIFYWQKNKAIALLDSQRVQFPVSTGFLDGFIRNITDTLSNVNPKIKNVTETLQFKRWF